MLDPMFKSLYLVLSFIEHEQSKAIVEEYDKRFLHMCFKMSSSFAPFG